MSCVVFTTPLYREGKERGYLEWGSSKWVEWCARYTLQVGFLVNQVSRKSGVQAKLCTLYKKGSFCDIRDDVIYFCRPHTCGTACQQFDFFGLPHVHV